MNKYQNRYEAGKTLGQQLSAYADRTDVIVFALPRGGVPVGFEIAKALSAPLDVFIVRKLGVPEHRELAMGAIATGGAKILNDYVINDLNISQHAIQAVLLEEQQELKRREKAYRGDQPFPSLKNKIVILVDDGIATGASIRAAIKALQQFSPARLVVAVPVADKSICAEIRPLVDEFICPLQPSSLYAVGAWYDDFSQTEDEEVYSLLRQTKEMNL